MLNDNAANNLFEQIHTMWIKPEIEFRKKTNSLSDDFKVYQCLIRLPQDSKPIVEFNNEIRWNAFVKYSKQREVAKDEPIYLHDIDYIETVEPPKVNNVRVAFVYLFSDGNSYRIIFDFSPNVPAGLMPDEEKEKWTLGKHIAESLQSILIERIIVSHNDVKELLSQIGLWAVPALLPYPLSEITVLVKNRKTEEAIELLKQRCTPDFIESLAQKWWNIEQFRDRRTLIEDAIVVHKERRYGLSIHALLPHIEGIVTDWIYTKIPEEEVPWRQESKTKKFRDLLAEGLPSTYTYQKIVESSLSFILNGPVLSTFQNWFDQIDKSFANRNVIGHGKYDDSLFSEENSIKLFLLLDTIYYIISGRDANEDEGES